MNCADSWRKNREILLVAFYLMQVNGDAQETEHNPKRGKKSHFL